MRHGNDSQTRNMGMEIRREFRAKHAKLETNISIFTYLLFWCTFMPHSSYKAFDVQFTYKNKYDIIQTNKEIGAMKIWEASRIAIKPGEG